MPAEPRDNSCRVLPQTYFADPCEVYLRLAPLGRAVLLDSGSDAERGRFDIIAAQPDPQLSLEIPASADTQALNSALANWQRLSARCGPGNAIAAPGDLPFCGGYIGHFSYELGRRLQGLPASTQCSLPLAMAHYYPWAIVQDRKAQQSWLLGDCSLSDELADQIRELLAAPAIAAGSDAFKLTGEFRGQWSLDEYRAVFDRVKQYIGAGDCYQINIGQRFSADFSGELFEAYRHLRDIARAPFSAYFPLNAGQALLSLSPERFLTLREQEVETRPIKGTRPRHTDPSLDAAAARELLSSDKERAENLMIVDLLRNDIGRFCKAGSVRAETLFSLESYATVHHLVSVVKGSLRPDTTGPELLLGCLPGGSITGAPKRRAMQIIDELEVAPRQAWCGTIFYLSRHGRMDSSITIRTLYNEHHKLHCWAGGGLVDDSRAEDEYQEQRDKVGAFISALESFQRDYPPGESRPSTPGDPDPQTGPQVRRESCV
jgi:para-aminobenzoate synthetase component 1